MENEFEKNNSVGGQNKKTKKPRKKWSKKKKIIFFVILGVVLALLAVGCVYAYNIIYNPRSQFQDVVQQHEASATPVPIEASAEPTMPEEIEVDEYELMLSQADLEMMDGIVNVMLIGVDYAPERETWSGKHAYHADVMLVLAIDFNENTVDMISLPRDTYAKIPGVDGIYKLNASLDCGGGWPTETGFQKVTEAASWMLGGIPVDYYYAVSMPAVKQLVDAVGGVDYDLEQDFDLAGRYYKKGQQHMDGQAVLDYLRVRKGQNISSGTGDLNRINRQKKMLVALFESMKKKDLLLKLPDILAAFDGQLYTNTSMAQTASLAVFAYNLSSENIAMHSMGGSQKNIFNWNFVITNQSDRVELIKEVYGIDVPKYKEYTLSAANARWQKMLAPKYISVATEALGAMEKILKEDAKLPIEGELDPSPSPAGSESPTVDPSESPSTAPSESPVVEPSSSPDETSGSTDDSATGFGIVQLGASATPQYRKYGVEEYLEYNKCLELLNKLKSIKNSNDGDALEQANTGLKNAVMALAKKLSYPITDNKWIYRYEKTENEIDVDFR